MKSYFLSSGVVALSVFAAPAYAHMQSSAAPQSNTIDDDAGSEKPGQGSVGALSEDIVVTARKRGEERLQKVPIAATAFGPLQLQALNFQSLQSISYAMPNVQLDGVGAVKGIANFSIRGLGINSSIPSIDPTVGVFVDGVYLGTTSGVTLDNFDIAGLEVLRGPQGVLFGRNVTGGAVLIRTTAPTDQLKVNLHAGIESGPRYTADGVVSGPLVEGLLSAKIGGYYSKDRGWFDDNRVGGGKLGASETKIARAALRLTPGDLDLVLRYDHNEGDGDGPVPQNHAIYSRKSYDYASAYPGFYDYRSDQLTLEGNLKVGFGDGTITSITGYRRYKGVSSSNIDATFRAAGVSDGINFGPGALFTLDTYTRQKQWSEELRYAGTFGPAELTTGVYYFQQDLNYVERRIIDTNLLVAGDSRPVGGGIGDFSTKGAFAAVDIHAFESLTFNLGLRYTEEKKKADISRIRAAGNALDGDVGGSFEGRTLDITDPGFDLSFHNWSPKVGVQWKPSDSVMAYGFWTLGYRSGGLNFRQTTLALTPRPLDQEQQSTFEIGTKLDLLDRRLRLNLAAFTNKIKNIQREQVTSDPISGIQQIIVNAGNARIRGIEGEANLRIANNLLISGQFGYLNGRYTKVDVDINGDRLIDARDKALKLPRLSPWSYGMNLTHDLNLGKAAVMTTRVSWNHRDRNFFSDNNVGFFHAADIIDANLTFRPAGSSFSISVYGTNLTNETTYGADAPLPDIPQFGGDGATGPRPIPTEGPLNRGRVIGVEARVSF